MAAGLPLICSDCGGGAEVVRDVGMLFPLGDDDALAACLLAAYNSRGSTDVAQILQKLQDRFSDEAVRERFWGLPFIRPLLNGQ
jgi:glycosyltransferase involved in cell wall biosynthesis